MKKAIMGLLLISLIIQAVSSAPLPAEKKVQFILGGNLLMLWMDGPDSTALIGAALRVDLNLGRSFIVAPELSAGIGGYTAGGTVNFRSGRFFAGLGGLLVNATEGGGGGEWGYQGFFKVHSGIRNHRSLFAVSFVLGDYIKGLGLTAGYAF